MAAPIGRPTKPMKKVPNADSVAVNASSLGKYSLPNTRPAAVPYRKKSYHSMVVPMVEAMTALRRWALWSAGVSCTGVAMVAIGFLLKSTSLARNFACMRFATSKRLPPPEFQWRARFRIAAASRTRKPRLSPGLPPAVLGGGGNGGHDSRSSQQHARPRAGSGELQTNRRFFVEVAGWCGFLGIAVKPTRPH